MWDAYATEHGGSPSSPLWRQQPNFTAAYIPRYRNPPIYTILNAGPGGIFGHFRGSGGTPRNAPQWSSFVLPHVARAAPGALALQRLATKDISSIRQSSSSMIDAPTKPRPPFKLTPFFIYLLSSGLGQGATNSD